MVLKLEPNFRMMEEDNEALFGPKTTGDQCDHRATYLLHNAHARTEAPALNAYDVSAPKN
jgi:hypothetical protein